MRRARERDPPDRGCSFRLGIGHGRFKQAGKETHESRDKVDAASENQRQASESRNGQKPPGCCLTDQASDATDSVDRKSEDTEARGKNPTEIRNAQLDAAGCKPGLAAAHCSGAHNLNPSAESNGKTGSRLAEECGRGVVLATLMGELPRCEHAAFVYRHVSQ